MKIAFLSRRYGIVSRGGETFVKELSARLSASHSVEILSGSRADSLSEILKGKFDLVISMDGRIQSLKASVGRIFGGYKLLIVGESGIGRDTIWNIVVCKPDVFVALTDKMYTWAKKWAWGSMVVKIPNGVDLDRFNNKGVALKIGLEKPVVLSVGALVWYKHHERTIEAVSLLQNVSLLIVGNGEEKAELERLGREKLGSRFQIMEAKFEEVPEIYRACDLFVLPSWDREAFGIVYIEAMACGLGVVAPDDSSRREIIGDAGIFVDAIDTKKYAEAILQALKVDWNKKAVDQAKKFSWDKITKEYENCLKNI